MIIFFSVLLYKEVLLKTTSEVPLKSGCPFIHEEKGVFFMKAVFPDDFVLTDCTSYIFFFSLFLFYNGDFYMTNSFF